VTILTEQVNVLRLAEEVCDCPEVANALRSSSHPCHEVVTVQGLTMERATRQRPEPWFGNLQAAKVLFISSNPSINEDPGDQREEFPTYEWEPERAAQFFVERITTRDDSPVTFGHPAEKNFLTRCLDGQYRSGVTQPKKPQPTWNNTHERALELLGPNADPRSNYAITEVVHCKSSMGRGVEASAGFCTDTWMRRILEASAANVVVLLGRHVRDKFAFARLDPPPDFGNGSSYAAMQPIDRCLRDTFVSDYGGRNRVYLFNWHPTAMKLRTLSKVYGPAAVQALHHVAQGSVPVPASSESLHAFLMR